MEIIELCWKIVKNMNTSHCVQKRVNMATPDSVLVKQCSAPFGRRLSVETFTRRTLQSDSLHMWVRCSKKKPLGTFSKMRSEHINQHWRDLIFSKSHNKSSVFFWKGEHHSAFIFLVHSYRFLTFSHHSKNPLEIIDTAKHIKSVTRCADLGSSGKLSSLQTRVELGFI